MSVWGEKHRVSVYWHHCVSNWWLKLAWRQSGPKTKHPSKPCTSAMGFYLSSTQSKGYFLFPRSLPFFFLSFLFTLHHLGLPQARLSLLFQAAPAREPLQQLLLHTFVSGAHQSQSHCLGSSQPCPCSDCFFWGFLGSCLPIKGQFLTLLSRELVENKLFLG